MSLSACHGDSGVRANRAGIIVCSCGVVGCSELGWPHEWDPVACGDTCVLSNGTRPVGMTVDPERGVVTQVVIDHLVRRPYVRLGSGYACRECAESTYG